MSIAELRLHFEKTASVEKQVTSTCLHLLDQIVACLNKLKNNSLQDDTNTSRQLTTLEKAINDLVQQIQSQGNDVLGKFKQLETIIGKSFRSDIDKIFHTEDFECRGSIVNEVLAHHFLREGHFEFYEIFSREASVVLPETYKNLFKEMFDILGELRQKRIQPAVLWAQQHRHALRSSGSTLEFKLHKLHFIHLLQLRQYEAALSYSQTMFAAVIKDAQSWPQQQSEYLREIQRLMGCFLYLNKLDTSPYVDLFSPTLWSDVEFAFTRDCCQFLGLSHDSPLFIITQLAGVSLPVLAKFFQVLQLSHGEWSQKDELPVEIPLSPQHHFHSTFVCPVSREQAKEDNPPMMMPCGHVVCRESLMRLSKNGGKFKCPYCPSESTPAQARRVFF